MCKARYLARDFDFMRYQQNNKPSAGRPAGSQGCLLHYTFKLSLKAEQQAGCICLTLA
jgi:hypothetical protein